MIDPLHPCLCIRRDGTWFAYGHSNGCDMVLEIEGEAYIGAILINGVHVFAAVPAEDAARFLATGEGQQE